jgi:N-methylhydantoinase A
MRRVSVDIGGTFTDCFVVWDGKYIEAKALTTHHNLALGFNEALSKAYHVLGLELEEILSQVDSVRYATTLGTNALIEHKGPKIGMLVTAGYEATVPCPVPAATAKAWTTWASRTCPMPSARFRWYWRT